MTKANCAVLGSGKIGTDLIYKLKASDTLAPKWMVGIDPNSEGLRLARDLGVKTTHEGIDGLLPHVEDDNVQIVFDATSAYAHAEHSAKLSAMGVRMVDLTPAAIGPMNVPAFGITDQIIGSSNVNMISCAGQATIPMVKAVSRVQPVAYAEIVASVASRSIGPGTRNNLDEFTHTTSSAIVDIGGAAQGKAIVIANPAEPPMLMRNTIYCEVEGMPDEAAIAASVQKMIAAVQAYVPGYRLVNGPVFDGSRVAIFIEVAGRGDYLPAYAGNLDIMTAAATQTAENIAVHLAGRQMEAAQ